MSVAKYFSWVVRKYPTPLIPVCSYAESTLWVYTSQNLVPRVDRYVHVSGPISPGDKYFCLKKVIFAFERSYITSAIRKSMLDVPVPGSF